MYNDLLNQKLRSLDIGFINPWKKRGFALTSFESFSYCEGYDIENISIIFRDDNIYVQFFKNDITLGTAVISTIVACSYAHDPALQVAIEGETFKVGNLVNKVGECFDFIFKILEKNQKEFIEVTLQYKNLRKARFHSQNIIFVVKPEYNDFYYLDKEVDRRSKKK